VGAFKTMKLEPLHIHITKELLHIRYGAKLPAKIQPADMVDLFDNIHLHIGELRPSYSELKEYWAEQFKAAVKKKNVSVRFDPRSKYQNLNTHVGAFDLAKRELKRFGGFWYRFSKDDAAEILGKSACNKQVIDCDRFCKAMERCVRRTMRPSFISALRPRFPRINTIV